MRCKEMTADEVYTAIGKSNEEECYNIVRLINNNKMNEASRRIQVCYECDENTAIEVFYRFRKALGKLDQ